MRGLPPGFLTKPGLFVPAVPDMPMSPVPPAGASSLADSQTMASVVSISDATQAAFGNAMRVIFVGSTSGLDASIAGLPKRLRRLYLALC